MTFQIAVIILNYRTGPLTVECLVSLEKEIDSDTSVVVVDNHSDDGSSELIEECINRNNWGNWCRLISSKTNNGFAAGMNIGIHNVDAETYILLNSDTIVLPCAFSELRKALERNPDVGLVAPRLEDIDGGIDQNTFRFLTPVYEFIRAADTRQISSILSKFDVVIEPPGKIFEPQWVGFACVAIRKEVIDQVGPLDEGFFMYFEDIDYCRRVWENGWSVLYWPSARVVHLLGMSSGVTKKANVRRSRPAYYYEARAYYFKKHFGMFGFIAGNILWTAGRSISFFREKILSKSPFLREGEARDIWIGLRK